MDHLYQHELAIHFSLQGLIDTPTKFIQSDPLGMQFERLALLQAKSIDSDEAYTGNDKTKYFRLLIVCGMKSGENKWRMVRVVTYNADQPEDRPWRTLRPSDFQSQRLLLA